jgi:small subunit ribosomal protein S4
VARYTDAVCRLCRREGRKLYLKGERCESPKCAITKRNFPPGQHGLGRGKLSPYGQQLREKQRAKRYYGVFEAQFRKTFARAERMKGVTGTLLLCWKRGWTIWSIAWDLRRAARPRANWSVMAM